MGFSNRVMTENQMFPGCEPANAPLPPPAKSSPRILVVDDDGDIRRLNTEALLRSGYAVDAAPDGAAAWQALNHDHYDLMITDNNMPKLTGVELLEKIRAARMALPVIIASGTFFPPDATASPWQQPDATLLKPYTIAELLGMVGKILGETPDATTAPAAPASRKQQQSQAAPTVGPASRPPRSAHRILVADEDNDLRQMYAEALAGRGYEVDAVADGVAGWSALQANQYNLLITEHDLPKLSGVALVRKMRAAHMALPVVMAAERLPTNELVQNTTLQLAATLAKPFTIDVLLDMVNQIISAAAQAGGVHRPPARLVLADRRGGK
jgi:DNA-binding response OmpR family regulator